MRSRHRITATRDMMTGETTILVFGPQTPLGLEEHLRRMHAPAHLRKTLHEKQAFARATRGTRPTRAR